ncbi:hypothetical protein [Chryseobacterium populi]|uniref:Aspartyl protease n=1 Tax=Chryseobacterium populi TaxID=1144316 RepID=J2T3S0_9FLAO|nr:hypothetical protein [Chryseobacterium populi]EJL72662.1 hypothetical protein PMI13_01809 [Chryseobacterium populi]
MKTFRKIAFTLLIIFIVLSAGGYVYFDKKFTPPPNTLIVSGISENIPVKWVADGDNLYSALLLPVRLKGISQVFYMQLDTGSPTTVFYTNSLQSIHEKISPKSNLKNIFSSFKLNKMEVSSSGFQLINHGDSADTENPEAVNIIGTIGNDLLEKRIIILNFKDHTCSFTDRIDEKGFSGFEFKKRKILLPAKIGNEKLKLMFDSGTSGYELITNKESWDQYRLSNSHIKSEKGNSWGNTLSIKSSAAHQKIEMGSSILKLSEVTYIEGTSKMQNFLMKSSGMKGMLGNKIFINHILILDCKREKFMIKESEVKHSK